MDQSSIELDRKTQILSDGAAFSGLDHDVLRRITSQMQAITLRDGKLLLEQGSGEGSGLYIVVRGSLCATIFTDSGMEQLVGWINPGDYLGEIELLTGQPRTANVKAATDSELLFLPKADFEKLAAEIPDLYKVLRDIAQGRMRRNQLFHILPDYFGELDTEKMETIERAAEWVHLDGGEQLVRYHDSGSDFFILVNGKLQARVPDKDGVESPVGEISAGESVGEIGFFTEELRTASVYAVRDSDLVRFSKQSLLTIQSRYPQFTFQFAQQIVKRLRRQAQPKDSQQVQMNLCLVAASPDVPLKQFANDFTVALSAYVTCAHYNSKKLDDRFKPGFSQVAKGDLNEIRLASWLDDQEKNYPYLVYESDRDRSNWTLRSLEHADRVILVAKSDSEPDLARLQALIAPRALEDIHLELALLYENPDSQPRNTARWLDTLGQVKRHYHIRTYRNDDYRRIARILTGNALGLALGGGGARGFAHIGVLRAFAEYGIDIDMVGGTSIGSIIGAGVATGQDWESIYSRARNHLNIKKLMDYTFPNTAFVTGRAYTDVLKSFYGDTNIEDAWIEYFCISSNLTTAEQMIHTRGPIWKYTRASSALPPVFSPVQDGNELLIDGVMANNLPVDIMRQICAGGKVIGVDVSAEAIIREVFEVGTYLPGWPLLLDKLIPFRTKKNVPNLMNIWMRMAEFSSVRLKKAQYRVPDLMIRPDVEKIGLFQLEDIDEIFELGYRAAKDALQGWKQ